MRRKVTRGEGLFGIEKQRARDAKWDEVERECDDLYAMIYSIYRSQDLTNMLRIESFGSVERT